MSVQITLREPASYRGAIGALSIAANAVNPGTTFYSSAETWYPSPNQKYVLILQVDGNLVLYKVIGNPPPLKEGVTFTGDPIWAAGTQGNYADTFVVQENGDMDIYTVDRGVAWSSGTGGIEPAGLYLQDDGNLVLYQLSPEWASNTSD